MKKIFPYLFLVIFVLQLIGVYLDSPLRLMTKPLIMISLAFYYFVYARSFKMLFFAAIVAALMGDIFLMWEDEMSFILGLSSFLLMQVLYTVIFTSQKDTHDIYDWIGAVLVAVAAAGIMYVLIPDVEGVLKIAVSVYCLCIMAMVVSAVWRKKPHWSYVPVLCGALLFMISDAILAINRFSIAIEYGSLIVIGTYMVAQYLIVMAISNSE